MRRVVHKRRPRKSRFDPYIDEIRDMVASGMSYSQIADEFSERMDIDIEPCTIGYYVRCRGLQSRVTRGKNDGRVFIPHCKSCEYRSEVMNTLRTGNWLMCEKMRAIISRTCQTSPMDCPLREKGSIYEV